LIRFLILLIIAFSVNTLASIGTDNIDNVNKVPAKSTSLLNKEEKLKKKSSAILTQSEQEWLENNPNVSFTADPNWLPFEAFNDQGKYIGIAADHLKAIEQSTSLHVNKVVSKSWDDAVAMAMNSKVDIISGVVGEKFSDKYIATEPYLENKIVIVMPKDSKIIHDPKTELLDKKIAIIKDYGYVGEVLQKYPDLDFIQVKNVQEGLSGVVTGQFDAMFGSVALLSYTMENEGLYQLRIVGQSDITMKLALFVKKENPELYSIISKGLQNISTKQHNKILSNWFMQSDALDKKPIEEFKEVGLADVLPLRELGITFVIALLLLSGVIIYYRRSEEKEISLKGPIAVFIGIFLVLVTLTTLLILHNLHNKQTREIQTSLKIVLNTAYNTLKIWIDEQKKIVDFLVGNKELASHISDLINGDTSKKALIKEYMQHYQELYNHREYYILSLDHKIIMHSSDNNIIQKNINTHYQKYLRIALQNGESFVPPFVTDGLRSNNIYLIKRISYKAESIALLVLSIDPTEEFSQILHQGRMGKSGETYVINSDAYLSSSSRFDYQLKEMGLLKKNETSFLTLKIQTPDQELTYSAQNVLKKKHGSNVEGYRDYRGIKVFGSWRWLDEYNLGIITEIDESEAIGQMIGMERTLAVIIFSIVLFALMLTFLIMWISSRSKKMLESKNEELKEFSKTLEKKVIERTQELTQREEQLKQNNEQMTFVSNYANFGFWTFNPQVGDLLVNDVFVNMLGYDTAEVLLPGFEDQMFKPFKEGLAFWEQLLHPDDVQHTTEMLTAHLNGETELYKVDYRMRRADGSWMWSTAIGRIAEYNDEGKPIVFNGVNIDISEVKEAQHLIEAQQQQFESMVSNVTGVIYRCLLDENWTMLYVSDEIEHLSGFPVSDFLHNKVRSFADIMYPEDTGSTAKSIQNQIDKDGKFVSNYRIVRADGKVRWVRGQGQAVYSEDGTTRWLDGAIFDITDQKEAEEKVEEQRMFLNTLLDSQEQIVITTNGQKLLSVNAAFKAFFDVKNIEAFTENHACICDTFNTEAPEGYLQKQMGQLSWIEYILAHPNQTQKVEIYWNNTLHTFSVTAAKLPIKDEYILSAVFTNISTLEAQRKTLEVLHEKISDSIDYASLIQHALIPKSDTFKAFFSDSLTLWEPRDVVGGDIYLTEQLSDNEIVAMVIDCTGHGVPGAFVTMLVKAVEQQILASIKDKKTYVSPGKMLEIFNKSIKLLLQQESDDSISNAGFDAGILYYNKAKQLVRFAGAEIPLFVLKKGGLEVIKGNRHSVGYKKSDINYKFTDHELHVKDDTQFYITSDGYLDQNGGAKGFPFGKRRFKELLKAHETKSMSDQKKLFIEALHDYQGEHERNDDITLVALKIVANQEAT